MFGPDMGMEMEEGEEEVSDEEEENAEAAIENLKKRALEKKGIVGFQKGGDVDKSLKAAKKNAQKNTVQDDSDEEEDDDEEEEVP